MKMCSKCKDIKDLTNFSRNRTRLDGYEYWCKTCNSNRQIRHYDPSKKKQYYLANKEKILENRKQVKRGHAYYKAHYEKYKNSIKRWINNNRSAVNAIAAKRRAQIKNATPKWADLAKIKEIYDKAQIFNLVFKDQGPWEVDHIFPLQNTTVCGLHVHWNLQLLPAKENRRKWNKVPA